MSEGILQSIFENTIKRFGKRVALIFDEKEITYRKLDKESNRLANGLKSLGITQGAKVGIMLPNIPEFVYAFFAIQKLGAIAVPINTLYRAGEILHVLRDSGAETVVTLSNYVPAIQEILHETNLKHIISVGEHDLVFADPCCKLVHLVLDKCNFEDTDEIYQKMGHILMQIVRELGVANAWYKHRGSVRVDGKRLGGIVVQETENDYVVTLNLFIDRLNIDDFLEVIWVPAEIRDRIIEPITSIKEETGKTVTHEEFHEVVLSTLGTVLKRDLSHGKFTRDESFAYQRRKNLARK